MRSTTLHPYALCTFPKSKALQHARAHCAQCTTTFQVMNHRRALVEPYQCSVPNSRHSPKFPEVKMPIYICCAMCIEQLLCTCTMQLIIKCNVPWNYAHWALINVPNLVSLAKNFQEPEDPSWIKCFGPGACSLHLTRTATRAAYRLGQYTCDLQVWDRWCTSFCRRGRQKTKRCKTLARALHVGTLGLYTCDLQILGRWGLPFGLQGWLKNCESLHAAARATCHVRRAPLKSTKSRVRRVGLSTLKI